MSEEEGIFGIWSGMEHIRFVRQKVLSLGSSERRTSTVFRFIRRRWFVWVVSMALFGLGGLLTSCTAQQVVRVPVTVVVTATPSNESLDTPSVQTVTPSIGMPNVAEGMIISISVDDQRQRWTAQQPAEYLNRVAATSLQNEAMVRAGEELYQTHYCSVCHGAEGKGDGTLSSGLNPKPIDFTDSALMQRLDDSYLYWRISEGGSQPPFLSAMPAWKDILSEEERWQLIAFLRSLQPAPSDTVAATDGTSSGGEPVVSEQLGLNLLQSNGCMACHRYAGQGSHVGPDLDGIGTRNDAEYIRVSIVDPAATIAEGYPNVMPRDYEKKISADDIDLLVAFLVQSQELK